MTSPSLALRVRIDIRFTRYWRIQDVFGAGSWWHFGRQQYRARSDKCVSLEWAAYVHVFPNKTSGFGPRIQSDPLLPRSVLVARNGYCDEYHLWLVRFALRISSRPYKLALILLGLLPGRHNGHQSQTCLRCSETSKEATTAARAQLLVWNGFSSFDTLFFTRLHWLVP